jgi:hypothetical protein
MSVATFEAVVENGQIKVPHNVHLPERTKVYVVVPQQGEPGVVALRSPRLVDPDKANDFKMTILPIYGDGHSLSRTQRRT